MAHTENKKLNMELENLTNVYLFRAYSENNHVETKHIGKDIGYLKYRMRTELKNIDDELAAISVFTGNIEDVLQLIYLTLKNNQKDLEDWLENPDGLIEFVCDFDSPIGYGIVKGADWNQPLNMSRVSVILAESYVPGQSFKIVTAYPTFNMDEADNAYDAVDSWSYR